MWLEEDTALTFEEDMIGDVWIFMMVEYDVYNLLDLIWMVPDVMGIGY